MAPPTEILSENEKKETIMKEKHTHNREHKAAKMYNSVNYLRKKAKQLYSHYIE